MTAASSLAPRRGATDRGTRRGGPDVASILGIVVAFWGFFLGARPLFDNSFFTHLTTGRTILEAGSLPTADAYSYTAFGEPWVVQSWIASLLYGVADRLGGGVGLRVLSGLTAAAVAAAVWALSRPAKALVGRVAICSLVLVVGGVMWSSRPFMFGLAILGLTLLVVERARWPVWILVPALWVWANTHGSFPLGLGALAAIALGSRFDDGSFRRREVRALAWAVGGTVAAMVGPLGLQVLTFPVALLGKSEILQRVIEWQSPNFSQGYARVFLVQVALAIVLIVRTPSWRAALPTLVFLVASLWAVRNIGVCSIVLVPLMARSWRGLGTVDGRERGVPIRIAAAVVLVIGTIGAGGFVRERPYDLSTYPQAAVSLLMAETAPNGGGCRLLTEDTNGNYLELLYGAGAGPRVPVFIDDRYDMYPMPVLTDYLRLHVGDPAWRDVLLRWDVQQVLWSRSSPLAPLLTEDPDWRVRYTDGAWVVFQRRAGERACQR